MTSKLRTIAIACLLGASALVITACGSSVPASELESQIEGNYQQQTGLALASIDCEDADGEVGAEVSCSGTNEVGIELEMTGEVTEIDDGTASFTWEVVTAFAPGANVEEPAKVALENQTGEQLQGVSCPERVEMGTDKEVRCTVTTADGSKLGATITFTNDEGGFNIAVDES